MPTSTKTDPRFPLLFPHAGAGDLFATARQAAGVATRTNLAGLDAVAGAQRRLVAGTPLAPVSDALDAQVKLTRRVLEDLIAGEAPAPGAAPAAAGATEEAPPAAAAAPRTSRGRSGAPSGSRPGARRTSRSRPAAKRSASTSRASTPASGDAAPAKARSTRASRGAAASRPASASRSRTPASPGRTARSAAAPSATPAASAAQTAAPAPAEPFAGYGGLTVEQVTGRLAELSQRALQEVRAYETANAARQTVLERIDALVADEPLPGYDELTVEDIVPRLADGGRAVAARVLEYERAHRQRAGVLEAAERQAADAS